jgi:hypothetical protein
VLPDTHARIHYACEPVLVMLRRDNWWIAARVCIASARKRAILYGITGRAAAGTASAEIDKVPTPPDTRQAMNCLSDALFDGLRVRLLPGLDRLHHTNSKGLSPIPPAPLHKQFIPAPSLGGRVHPASETSQAAKQGRCEPD